MIRFYSEFLFYDLGSGLAKLFGNSCFHSKKYQFFHLTRSWLDNGPGRNFFNAL